METLNDRIDKEEAKENQNVDGLLLKAKCYLEAGNYEKAVDCYEQIHVIDSAREEDYVVPFAKACRGCGLELDAIHWFRRAIDKYGKKMYEKDLMRLYQTGVVGTVLKEKADQYFG